MTRSVEIPDETVRKALDGYCSVPTYGTYQGQFDAMRAALKAALPYLAPAATCASVYRGRAGLEKCTLDPGHEDNHVGFRTVWTDEDSAAPAVDGGLREALEQLARRWQYVGEPVDMTRTEMVMDDCADELKGVLAAAPAVPQPVDREALGKAIEQAAIGVDLAKYFLPGTTDRFVDAVLALLAGEQEQVET